jgi:pimeloyl-ACP methyl ester carboxylesterase
MKANTILLLMCISLLTGCRNQPSSNLPSDTSTITLSENRLLGYVAFGPADGTPVFYFHGFPGSHKDIGLFKGTELAEKHGLRLIAVNRPGYGNSGSLADRSLVDWPGDLIKLADALNLGNFSILGYSGGGPYALACAYAIPERIDKVIIVSGMGPSDAPESKKGAAMLIPKAPKLILKGMSKMVYEKPEKMEANMRKGFPETDQKILDMPGVQTAMNQTLQEAFSSGYQGALEDAKIYKGEWGFNLADISSSMVLWHGALDENVKIETARYVSEQMPNCKSIFKENEGHLSLIYHHADEIFGSFSNH